MKRSSELEAKYGHWGSHPDYPVNDWKHHVAESDTRLGYWDWVVQALESAEAETDVPR